MCAETPENNSITVSIYAYKSIIFVPAFRAATKQCVLKVMAATRWGGHAGHFLSTLKF